MCATISCSLVPVQSDASTLVHGRKCDLGDDPGFAAASSEAFARRQKSSEQSESYFKVRKKERI
jgi:hypothetical protein